MYSFNQTRERAANLESENKTALAPYLIFIVAILWVERFFILLKFVFNSQLLNYYKANYIVFHGQG